VWRVVRVCGTECYREISSHALLSEAVAARDRLIAQTCGHPHLIRKPSGRRLTPPLKIPVDVRRTPRERARRRPVTLVVNLTGPQSARLEKYLAHCSERGRPPNIVQARAETRCLLAESEFARQVRVFAEAREKK